MFSFIIYGDMAGVKSHTCPHLQILDPVHNQKNQRKCKRHDLRGANDLRFQLSLKMKYVLFCWDAVPGSPFVTGQACFCGCKRNVCPVNKFISWARGTQGFSGWTLEEFSGSHASHRILPSTEVLRSTELHFP